MGKQWYRYHSPFITRCERRPTGHLSGPPIMYSSEYYIVRAVNVVHIYNRLVIWNSTVCTSICLPGHGGFICFAYIIPSRLTTNVSQSPHLVHFPQESDLSATSLVLCLCGNVIDLPFFFAFPVR